VKNEWSFNLFESHCFYVAFLAILDSGSESKILDAHAIGAVWIPTFVAKNKQYDLEQRGLDQDSGMRVAPAGSDEELFEYLILGELKRLKQLEESSIALACSHSAERHAESLQRWHEKTLQ